MAAFAQAPAAAPADRSGWRTNVGLSIVLAALLGLRKGEMAEARWEDIDWDAGRVLVRGTKTELSGSSLPLHPSLRAYLEPYRQPGPLETGVPGDEHPAALETGALGRKAGRGGH